MDQSCRVCHGTGTVLVNVTDPKTGKISENVCLCDECLEKVSKAREIKVVKRLDIPKEQPSPPEGTKTPEEDAEAQPLYLRNVYKISNIFSILSRIGWFATIIAAVVFVVSLVSKDVTNAYISAPILGGGIALIIGNYIPMLIADAVADYLERNKK